MLTLDLACPIAWKSAGQVAASNNSNSSSVSGVSLSSPTPAPRKSALLPAIRDNSCRACDEHWLQWRYSEALWLGEEHSPLRGFLQHLQRYERRQRQAQQEGTSLVASSSLTSQLVSSLAKLLKTRQSIRKRFIAAVGAATPAAEAIDDSNGDYESRTEAVLGQLCKSNDGQEDNAVEREVVKMALESGPGALVAAELRSTSSKPSTKMTKLWLQAMECRELQIQILVILYLLRLSTQLPVAVTASTSISSSTAGTHPSEKENCSPVGNVQSNAAGDSAAKTPVTAKRKRKADHAQRWTGVKGMVAFPWTLQRQGSKEKLPSAASNEETNEDITSPENLSRRFETLLDSLCLQVLTSNTCLDGSSLVEDLSPSPARRLKQITASHRLQPWQLFGSEGRRRQQSKEDKDVLQWLCCHIIEPYFSKTLPRQCGIVRGKCFVPGSGSTPAKASVKEHPHAQRHRPGLLPLVAGPAEIKSKSTSQVTSTRSDSFGRMPRASVPPRARSQSPAPASWSLLAAENPPRPQDMGSTSSLIGKWDARTVSVRKKWDRSQSIGPSTTTASSSSSSSSLTPGEAANRHVRPLQRSGSTNDPMREVKKEPRSPRRYSQTLVMATPSKGQSSRSSSFSNMHGRPPLSTSTSWNASSAAISSSWRRTESQPPFSAPANSMPRVEMASQQEKGEDEEDFAASSPFLGSDKDDQSGDEDAAGSPDWPNTSPIPDEGEELKVTASIASHISMSPQRGRVTTPTKRPPLRQQYQPEQPSNNLHHHGMDSGDESDGDTMMIAKKRRTLPTSLSFAFLQQQQQQPPRSQATNPFAVAQ